MIGRYWVEFDEEGDIKSVHKNKYDCESPCEEYVVKLIPISRTESQLDELDQQAVDLERSGKRVKLNTNKLKTEIEKLARDARRIKL